MEVFAHVVQCRERATSGGIPRPLLANFRVTGDHRPERRRRPRAAYYVRRDLISRWDEDLARGISAVKFPVWALHGQVNFGKSADASFR